MTKSKLNGIRAAIGVTVLSASTLSAGTFVVNTTADSGSGSLRQAILSANSHGGGDITFYKISGTITLQSSLPAISQCTTILGPGTNVLTVSGSGQYSIFSINAGVGSMISGLTIANGRTAGSSAPAQASGVANAGQLELRNCVIRNCMSFFSDGAAVYNSGNLQMIGCLVANSGSTTGDADVDGGAIFNSGGLTMTECTIFNCTATQGGGIFNTGSSLLTNCILNGCANDSSDGNGAGIYNDAGNFIVEGCTITNCQAGFDGGGILSFANLTVRRSTITDNNALEGGGLYLADGSNFLHNCTICGNADFGSGGAGIKNLKSLTMKDCTLNGNFSYGGGGGIENLDQLVMTNCTISGNSCFVPGSAILNTTTNWDGDIFSNATAQITDCTIVSNNVVGANGVGGIANDGGTVFLASSILADNMTADFAGVLTSGGYDLILNTTGVTLNGDLTGNIYGQEPLLGPLTNNGGRTFTHALLPGSPAIGTGPVGGPPHLDQRGMPRPQGVADDIGAFELTTRHNHFLSLTNSGNGLQIGLTGYPGLNYTIQHASSINGPWTTLTNVTAGPDGCGACTDARSAAGSGFYRSVFH